MLVLNPIAMGNLTKLNIKSYIDADYIVKATTHRNYRAVAFIRLGG